MELTMGFADRFDALNNHVTLFFLRFVGPPSVGSPDGRGRAASEDERAREVEIRQSFERVTGPDGRPYLVERPSSEG
jgi:hypothetical protein